MELSKKKFPRITIITVTYNCIHTIEQTIQSIVQQTYEHIEYIIIDGGSTDGTVDIIKKYQDQLAYWHSEPDRGIYDAMNKGVMRSKGDYIQFLGGDDCLVARGIIEQVAQVLAADEKIDILSAPVWAVDEDLRLQRIFPNRLTEAAIHGGQTLPHQGLFARQKLLKQTMFDIGYKIAADYDFILSCYFNPDIRFKYVDFPVSYYGASGVSGLSVTKRIQEHRQVMMKYNLSQKVILKIEKRLGLCRRITRVIRIYFRKWLRILISPLYNISFFRNRLFPNWVKHVCEWENCRWCKGNRSKRS